MKSNTSTKDFISFEESKPRFGEGIAIILSNGNKTIGRRERHPIYKGEDCYVLENTNFNSRMISWMYITDLIKS